MGHWQGREVGRKRRELCGGRHTVEVARGERAAPTRAPAIPCRYYSLFTLFMLITFECTVVQQRLRNLRELRGLQTPKQHVQVYRCRGGVQVHMRLLSLWSDSDGAHGRADLPGSHHAWAPLAALAPAVARPRAGVANGLCCLARLCSQAISSPSAGLSEVGAG